MANPTAPIFENWKLCEQTRKNRIAVQSELHTCDRSTGCDVERLKRMVDDMQAYTKRNCRTERKLETWKAALEDAQQRKSAACSSQAHPQTNPDCTDARSYLDFVHKAYKEALSKKGWWTQEGRRDPGLPYMPPDLQREIFTQRAANAKSKPNQLRQVAQQGLAKHVMIQLLQLCTMMGVALDDFLSEPDMKRFKTYYKAVHAYFDMVKNMHMHQETLPVPFRMIQEFLKKHGLFHDAKPNSMAMNVNYMKVILTHRTELVKLQEDLKSWIVTSLNGLSLTRQTGPIEAAFAEQRLKATSPSTRR